MKRQSEEEKFISELLADDGELSRRTLDHGLTLMRRKRARRLAWRAAALVAPVVILAVFLFGRHGRPPIVHQTRVERSTLSDQSKATPRVIEGTSIRILTDGELLDFFTNRPVALVGPPGKQTLILFDESKN